MSTRDEELHRLADGELDEQAAESLRGSLDDADRARLDAIAGIGAAVRHTLAAEAKEVDLWAGIAARLPAASTEKAPAVVPIDGKIEAKKAALRSWRDRARGPLRIGLPLLAVAAALAVLFARMGVPVTNACDIESLEVAGSSATVLKLHDQGTTTVIWTTEE